MPRQRAIRGSGSVYKDKHRPRWVGQVVIDGRRRRVYARTKTDARQKLNELIQNGAPRPRDDKGRPLRGLLNEWIRQDVAGRHIAGKPLSPATRARHSWAVGHLSSLIGDVPVRRLRIADVEDALACLVDEGLGQASATKVLQSLRQALDYAVRRGEVETNVAKSSLVPAHAARPAPRQALDPSDASEFLDAVVNERNGLMFALMLRLGLRPGEATAVYWADVDLEQGTVNITRGLQLDRGRASVVDELKTSSAKRTLRLPTDLVEQLERHRLAQIAERLSAPSWEDERLVFTSPRGNVLSPPNVRRHLENICKGITTKRAESDPHSVDFPNVRPNELRHSCASYLVDQGVGIEVVADVLGHTSTRMVDATYRHRLRPVVEATASIDWRENQ